MRTSERSRALRGVPWSEGRTRPNLRTSADCGLLRARAQRSAISAESQGHFIEPSIGERITPESRRHPERRCMCRSLGAALLPIHTRSPGYLAGAPRFVARGLLDRTLVWRASIIRSPLPNAQTERAGCLARSVPARSAEIALIVTGNRLRSSASLGSF